MSSIKTRPVRFLLGTALCGALMLMPVTQPQAQELVTGPISAGYNAYGVPGLIEMPNAYGDTDGMLATSVSRLGDTTRTTLSFQITPRLSGSFRYSGIANFNDPSSVDGTYYDRSFDLKYQLITEGRLRPAIAIGLQDFIGTGLFGAEYIVASKTLNDRLQITGGLGWGRLGSYRPLTTIGTRPDTVLGQGGVPSYDRWFRGDMAAFGGISYKLNDKLTLKAEYSSDNYDIEQRRAGFDRDSPFNFGLDYRPRDGVQLSLYHAYGGALGAQLTLLANPRKPTIPGGGEGAPFPVAPRAPGASKDLGWAEQPDATSRLKKRLDALLENDDLVAEGLDLTATTASVRLINRRYETTAQAVGRTARAMSRVMPASVETFVIVPVDKGIPLSAVRLRRSDLERLEHADSDDMLAQAQIVDGFGLAPRPDDGTYPSFTWSLRPFVSFSAFDPQQPLRMDLRARLRADYKITPSLVLSGAVTKTLAGNIADAANKTNNSKLPPVRTNFALYAREGDPALERLTLSHYGRPAPDYYSRVTFGYLETMFAGISGEMLWKPVTSRLALGAELNYVQQRDFDQRFGLQDYDVVTGHLSAYYDFGNGFLGQLDVGRYLAGDNGATISLDRTFSNGWRVGAYATFTDTSAEDFGEGSFDKGLRVTVPLSWVTGQPSRQSSTIGLQSLTRDGGARLRVSDRLYEVTRERHQPEMAKTWGTFWR